MAVEDERMDWSAYRGRPEPLQYERFMGGPVKPEDMPELARRVREVVLRSPKLRPYEVRREVRIDAPTIVYEDLRLNALYEAGMLSWAEIQSARGLGWKPLSGRRIISAKIGHPPSRKRQ